jgi:Cdc6-like AAA superfamily ATPase
VSGSGKTLILRKLIEEENNSIYISGRETKTSFKTIKAILNINSKTYSDVLVKTIAKLKENPKMLVFDEVDKIKGLREFFNDLNTIYRKTMVPIIIITMNRNIFSSMPEDAEKTLFFKKINLPSYNAIELRDILASRLKQIRLELPLIEDGVINYISAIAARGGSARVLLFLTLKCMQENRFDVEFIDETYAEMMKKEWFGFVEDINENEKEFLKYLLDLCDSEKEIYAEEIEKAIGLSQPRISQLLNTFEDYSVISTHHRNLGRGGGRKRIIKFKSKEIYDELKERM